jgi:hypothetical protein
LWWGLVIAGFGLYVVLLAGRYALLWLTDTAIIWVAVEVLLVALAVLAAVKDLSAVPARRPMRRIERIAMVSASVLVLLWLIGLLLLTWVVPDGRADVPRLVLGLLVAVPVLPVAALALPGTMVFRHARHASHA